MPPRALVVFISSCLLRSLRYFLDRFDRNRSPGMGRSGFPWQEWLRWRFLVEAFKVKFVLVGEEMEGAIEEFPHDDGVSRRRQWIGFRAARRGGDQPGITPSAIVLVKTVHLPLTQTK